MTPAAPTLEATTPTVTAWPTRALNSLRVKAGLDLPMAQAARQRDDVNVIDITAGLLEVIDQVTRCDFILSSSLHGLVIADAYGVPSRWVKLSDRPKGDGFKYGDHYSAIGRGVQEPVWLDEDARLEDAMQAGMDQGTTIDLDVLLEACPFRS